MVKAILKWTSDKTDDLVYEDSTPKAVAKAFGLGAIEGAIDAFTVIGAIVWTGLIVKMIKDR